MQVQLFTDWWMSLGWERQIFWSVAIVSTLLLGILLILDIFNIDFDGEEDSEDGRRRNRMFESRCVLVFFTGFGWSAVFLSGFWSNFRDVLVCSIVAGFLAGLTVRLITRYFSRMYRLHQFDAHRVVLATGEVLKPVPPHRNGFGKVHLNLRGAPFELEAVTAGQELPAGSSIRVVEIIDDRILLVEALENGYPHRAEKN